LYKYNFYYVYNHFFFLKYFLLFKKSIKNKNFLIKEFTDFYDKNKKNYTLKLLNRYMYNGNFSQVLNFFKQIYCKIKNKFKINFFFTIYLFLHLYKMSFNIKKKRKINKTFFFLQKLLPFQYNLFFFFFLRKINEKKKNFISLFLLHYEYLLFMSFKSIIYKQYLVVLDMANESKTNIINIKPPRLMVLEKKLYKK
jgi:hypothetical protein